MNSKRIITLTTDFGTRDHYAGVMKGVLLTINPNLTIIDNTHELNSFDIKQASFNLLNLYRYYPKGTIHIAVVDPGVGSKRKCLLISADGHYFIGPDNGVFSYVIDNSKSVKIISVTKKEYFLQNVSTTFHGRDIFAPVASHLSLGIKPREFGRTIIRYKKIEFIKPERNRNIISGLILYEDKFGNLITNIDSISAAGISEIRIDDILIPFISEKYSDVKKGGILAYIGSTGFLEISVNLGSAAEIVNKKSQIICFLK